MLLYLQNKQKPRRSGSRGEGELPVLTSAASEVLQKPLG